MRHRAATEQRTRNGTRTGCGPVPRAAWQAVPASPAASTSVCAHQHCSARLKEELFSTAPGLAHTEVCRDQSLLQLCVPPAQEGTPALPAQQPRPSLGGGSAVTLQCSLGSCPNTPGAPHGQKPSLPRSCWDLLSPRLVWRSPTQGQCAAPEAHQDRGAVYLWFLLAESRLSHPELHQSEGRQGIVLPDSFLGSDCCALCGNDAQIPG